MKIKTLELNTLVSKKQKRLLIDIETETHAQIKAMAALRNITIRTYVLRILNKELVKDIAYTKKSFKD